MDCSFWELTRKPAGSQIVWRDKSEMGKRFPPRMKVWGEGDENERWLIGWNFLFAFLGVLFVFMFAYHYEMWENAYWPVVVGNLQIKLIWSPDGSVLASVSCVQVIICSMQDSVKLDRIAMSQFDSD